MLEQKLGTKITKKVGNAALSSSIYLANKLAPIIAFASIAGPEPGPKDNIENIWKIPKSVYDIGMGYANNVGIRDFVNGQVAVAGEFLGDFCESIADNPQRAIYTALGTYAACKIPHVVSQVRKELEYRKLKKEKRKQEF